MPAWGWWLMATAAGAAIFGALTGSWGASGAVAAVGGAAAASEGARRRAERVAAEAAAVALRPLPPESERPATDPARWDGGPAGRD